MLTLHNFYDEAMDRVWFAPDLPSFQKRVGNLGKVYRVKASLEVRGADDLGDCGTDTLICLIVDDLIVPYRVPRDNFSPTPLDRKNLEKAIVSRLHEIIDKRASLVARTERMLRAARLQVDEVGHGARLTRFHFEPQDLFDPEEPVTKRYFILGREILSPTLEPTPTVSFTRTLEHVRDAFRHAKKLQAERATLRAERLARPGWSQASDVAALLMKRGNLTPSDWIAGQRLPKEMSVNGAALHNVAVYSDKLQFQPNFRFAGGRWIGDRLVLDHPLPETVRAALIGRPVTNLVQGGLFDLIDHKICAFVDHDDHTEVLLESRYVWVDDTSLEAAIVPVFSDRFDPSA